MSSPGSRDQDVYGRILGVGAYRPERVVDNGEVCRSIDSTEEWIRTRSGIETRRFAGPEETLEFMAVEAAGKALAHAGIAPSRVDAVVVASMTNLVQTPPLAVQVAHRLGAVGAAAFDLSAACAGFGYALGVASDMVRSSGAGCTVVIGTERATDIVDPHDRSIAFLFADGAGAAVVGPSRTAGIGPVVWGSDGSHHDALTMTRSWAEFAAAPEQGAPVMRMNGRRIFRWAVEEMVGVSNRAMERAGVTCEELGAFIPHQANMRITTMLAERIGLPPHVGIASDIADSGNTCAASIPLAMERMLETGEATSGDAALLVGFGAGLSYAAQVVRMP